ncbi:MAG: hypothetical protein FJ098_04205, partial [Deltaproteobacteria bacterium]|nr:hypothetical protein [Deltaproteobacteria bacterium]
MRLLRLLFLLAVLAAGSCRRAEPPPRAVLAAGDIVVELAETLPRGPAAWVNEREIPAASVEELARARGWPRARALRVLVDAALVTDEAARMGRGCTTPGAPDACAQELLEALYSEETVCRHIPEGEVDRAYQEAFDRDWPVEAYAGWVAEKRCCGGGD